ncbi:MAG TPA: HAMP domain-containing sensor histidine kinase [Acidobacteriota bacterium]|nr:HAMP domain-containing sensor histidine kinase [Acidobacteriota bacterium]
MSLKVKLFLFFGLLIVGVLAFHWWLFNRAAQASIEQSGEAALSAAREVADFFDQRVQNLLRDLSEGGELTRVEARESILVGEGQAEEGENKSRRQVRILKHPPDRAPQSSGEESPADPPSRRPSEPEPTSVAPSADGQERWIVREEFLTREGEEGLSTQVELQDDESGFKATLRVKGQGFERSIEIPSTDVEATLADLRRRLLGGTFLALLLGLSGAGFLAYGVSRPLGKLSQAARRVAAGDLGLQVSDRTGGEVGAALTSFNQMSRQLEELDLQKRRWQQEEHLSELGQIARGFAHTIRNPLNTLGLAIEELASCPPDDPKARELAAAARRQTARIDSWIRSFLSLAADGEGLREPVDLCRLLEDVVLESVQQGQAQVVLDLPEDQELTLKGVQNEVRGMVQALAVNAVEASPQGHIRIAARAHPEGGVVVSVEDDGPGLPDEVRQRLFTPHVTTKSQGSGMGLYLAHRVAVTRYDGSLSIEDRDPAGSRALLHLRNRRGPHEGTALTTAEDKQ